MPIVRRRPPEREVASPHSGAAVMPRVAARLDALGFTPGAEFDLASFIEQVQDHCGRPILLVQRNDPECGFAFEANGTLYVCYPATTSPLQRIHNVVHECAHILLGHEAVAPLRAAQVSRGDVGTSGGGESSEVDRSMDAEWEAEAAAALLLGRWREPPAHQWASMSALREGAARTAAAFGWSTEQGRAQSGRAHAAIGLAIALVVTVFAGLPWVSDLLSALAPDLGLAAAVPALSIAAAGSAAFALARRMSLHPWLLRWSTPTVAAVLALAQLVLWWAGEHGDPAALLVLLVVSLLWPAATMSLLLVVAGRYRTLLTPRGTKAALVLVRAGLAAAIAALGVEALRSTGSAVVGAAGGILQTAGAGVLALAVTSVVAGLVLPHISGQLAPLVHWVQAHRAYRQLDWLYTQVEQYVPHWAPLPSIVPSAAAGTRAAETRLYLRVIAIRDMCRVLLTGMNEHQAAAAVRFAERHTDPPTRKQVEAAAEACALAEAISIHLLYGGIDEELQHTITTPDKIDRGSLTEEAANLIRMAKVWRGWRKRGLIAQYVEQALSSTSTRQER